MPRGNAARAMRAVSSGTGTGGTDCGRRSDMDDLQTREPSNARAPTTLPICGALAAALNKGQPGSAAVDVYEDEPVLGATYPLIGMANALCTPHLGYVERDYYEALLGAAVDQILAFAAGHPVNVVNPEVVQHP